MPVVTQQCGRPGCESVAAYATRTRPAWCTEHIVAALAERGLAPLEPFPGPRAWWLLQCLTCEVALHYLWDSVCDARTDFVACGACRIRDAATELREGPYGLTRWEPVTVAQAQAKAEPHGHDVVAALTDPCLVDDPLLVRCRYCGRLAAKRLGDLGFACSCQTNPRRAAQTARVAGPRRADLLKDAEVPARQWWDHDANPEALWQTVGLRARRQVTWRCPDCGLSFEASVVEMVARPRCPACAAQEQARWEQEYARLEALTVAEVEELVAAWDDETDPSQVGVTSRGEYRLRCERGHARRMAPYSFLTRGCPSCRAETTRARRRQEAAEDPAAFAISPEIAAQWHPTRNAGVVPARVSPNSRRALWWLCTECAHEWQQTPAAREMGERLRCPRCHSRLDSLAFHYPQLAAQWAPDNPVTAWQVRPSGRTTFTPSWVCDVDSTHRWQASVASRTTGSGCPQCRVAGKSRPELAHYEAALAVFGNAASGQLVRSEAFTRHSRWLVDVVVTLPSGRLLAVEYDGAYWHADKADLDVAKSRDLLASGYRLVRLREHPLPALPLADPDYLELVVYAGADDPLRAVTRIQEWATATATG